MDIQRPATIAASGERSCPAGPPPFLRRLAQDTSGNTLMLMAAALLPLMGMIGGGVDMSRAYLAESRLQQACDAGVLAARKRLGSQAVVTGVVPDDVAQIGDRFFNLNFRDGSYGTEDRSFQMYLEEDYSISGEAAVTVPTAVMSIFGFEEVQVDVECEAVLSFQNLDLMMVLDSTGSMRTTNSGDSQTRMESMKQVIRDFHAEIEGNKPPGVRIRYGFVPYATNINVGHLLSNNWVVRNWTYQSRESVGSSTSVYERDYTEAWTYVSGVAGTPTTIRTYAPTWRPGTPPTGSGSVDQGPSGGTSGYYTCDGAVPASDFTAKYELISSRTEPYVGPPAGTKKINHNRITENGSYYYNRYDGNCHLERVTYDNLVQTYDHIYHPAYSGAVTEWRYRPISMSVTGWRTQTAGCIEERDTYEIDDYDNVDLTRALDLDIDLVPRANQPATQWRPRYRDMIYVRSIRGTGWGTITPEEVTSTQNFADTGRWWFSGCPAPAQKLGEMDSSALNSYLAKLSPEGATYHDIGMIWGGRLLSPTGLFASENADVSVNKPTNRNLIFLTDGQTEPYDLAYGTYGVDALDQRRWSQSSPLTLAETVEQRFLTACKEVKKRNITVWVIAFGTELNPVMTECAGEGRYFEASDAAQLSQAFETIAASLGDLRISQ
ncbi:Tad domain-containing protein [Altererythrobacter sp. H2]|uniref:Tad domain-containing protein n=1 Tax=Altererythrobacter sp. H2 TaxID=3108391 RepID=UPI002B4BE424|nr:Tad domain-containing protein [Altererythrobacter sp. H2]WRK94345.1 Tad domain-containing protein [Altererythrobacter sp. H2]